jgi:hypothetical protein
MSSVEGGKVEKLKKFTHIVKYVKATKPDLYEVIKDLGLKGNFTPPREGGLTFLMPDDKTVKEIVSLAYGDDVEKAIDIILAHILYGLFVKPTDFKRKDDIGTKCGTKLLVKNVSAKDVEIDNGTLVLDEKFKTLTRFGKHDRNNIAVWQLKGTVKYEGVEQAKRSARPSRKGPGAALFDAAVEGGDDSAANGSLRDTRNKILADKAVALATTAQGPDSGKLCPLLNAVCRVLRVWSESAARAGTTTYADEYRAAKCIITLCPLIDFFYIFNNPLVFSAEAVLSAYKAGVDQDNNVTFYKQFCSDYSNPALAHNTALMLSQSGMLRAQSARDHLREVILGRIAGKTTPGAMADAYKTLDSKNKIGDEIEIYPDWLGSKFNANPGLHLLLDEFAMLAYKANKEIKRQTYAKDKVIAFNDFISHVFAAYGPAGFVNPSNYTRLDKPTSYGGNLDNEALYQMLLDFWEHFGMHIPCSYAYDLEDRHVAGGNELINPMNKQLINVDAEFARDVNNYCNCPMQLSENTLSELRHYKRAHGGRLPDL